MVQEHVLKIYKTQLYSFDFLCKTIRENDIETLALTFLNMITFRDKYDEYLFDRNNVYGLTLTIEQQIDFMKRDMLISLGKIVGEDNYGTMSDELRDLYSYWNWIVEIKENIEEYIWLYNLFNDELSKDTFVRVLLGRSLNDYSFLYPVFKPVAYFGTDTFKKQKPMIYVDCGAYIGDTIDAFISNYGDSYEKIYGYEPTPKTFSELSNNTRKIKNIILKNCAVGNNNDFLRFAIASNASSANFINFNKNNSNDILIQMLRLDDDIEEPVSFIKMDIEGSELQALMGAKKHIINDKPQLAICVYHEMDDLRSIPKLIYSYNKKQEFYLRNHASSPNSALDLVFYANPY